jgi:hypothetical protein
MGSLVSQALSLPSRCRFSDSSLPKLLQHCLHSDMAWPVNHINQIEVE